MTLKHRYFGIFVSDIGWKHLTGDRGIVPLGHLFSDFTWRHHIGDRVIANARLLWTHCTEL